MLLKNVDTLDKLCNGSVGTVIGIDWNINKTDPLVKTNTPSMYVLVLAARIINRPWRAPAGAT